MSFWRRLFGRGEARPGQSTDEQGLYLYAQCDRCGTITRMRIDKQHELNQSPAGYVWHKTIVDSQCFRPMPTVVHFNQRYEPVSETIEGGRYVTEAEYLAASRPAEPARDPGAAGGPEPASDPDPAVDDPPPEA